MVGGDQEEGTVKNVKGLERDCVSMTLQDPIQCLDVSEGFTRVGQNTKFLVKVRLCGCK